MLSNSLDAVCPECGKTLREGSVCPECLLNLAVLDEGCTTQIEGENFASEWPEKPGEQIGRYRLLEIIGEGGFGTVWMAEQYEPVRRFVALKIVKLGMDTKEVVARFEAERQALALMDHPNIARVYDGGATATGRPYFVMELVRGVPITDFCDARKLNTRLRLELFVDVCYAVQHAHQKGVIHRDLKPSNLLVTEQDGKAVPKVLDFGIAKATASSLTDKTLFTRFNQFVGTPVYMSPEQAGLGGMDVDSRSDIYSLGVLLYELITGAVPINVRELVEERYDVVLGIIREGEPAKPSTKLSTLSRAELTKVAARRNEAPDELNKIVHGELDWLVLKALEKDRNRRYQTASALATDLLNYLSGDPVMAAPPSVAYQLRKFAHKHRRALASAGAVFLVLVAGVVATSWQALRATRLAASESSLRGASERQRQGQRISLYASEMSVAFRSWDLGEAERTRQILAQQPADLRGWEWGYLWQESRPSEVAVFTNQPGYVAALAYSRDGSRLAVGSGGNGHIRLWDAQQRRVSFERHIGRAIIDELVFTPDGSGLYATLRSTNFVLLDTRTLDERASFTGHSLRVSGLTLDRSGQYLVSAAGDFYGGGGPGEMLLWDTSNRQIIFKFPASRAGLKPRFSDSGRYLSVSSDKAGMIGVWEVGEKRRIAEIRTGAELVYTAAFSPDETILASGNEDGFVRLWDWRTREEPGIFGPHPGGVRDLAFSPDGKRLLSCSIDSTIRVWDVERRREQIRLRGHRGRVHGVTFSPDGKWIVSRGGPDQSLRFWDAKARASETLLDRQPDSLGWCQFVPGARAFCVLRTTEESSTFKVWRSDQLGSSDAPPVRNAASKEAAYLTPAGSEIALAIAGSDEISIQEPFTGRERLRLQSPYPLLGSMNCSRDGRWLASTAMPNWVVIWDLPQGRVVAAFELPGDAQFTSVAGSSSILFSADASRLWIAHPAWPEIVWCNWRAPSEWKAMSGHARGVSSLALSKDGKMLASGSTDMTAGLWEAATGARIAFLGGENGGVISLGFSADDKTLAMGCFDGQVRLWNVAARTEMVTLFAHKSTVYSVAFSADGRFLSSSSYDGTTRLWQALAPSAAAGQESL